jgi:hypothetical protein
LVARSFTRPRLTKAAPASVRRMPSWGSSVRTASPRPSARSESTLFGSGSSLKRRKWGQIPSWESSALAASPLPVHSFTIHFARFRFERKAAQMGTIAGLPGRLPAGPHEGGGSPPSSSETAGTGPCVLRFIPGEVNRTTSGVRQRQLLLQRGLLAAQTILGVMGRTMQVVVLTILIAAGSLSHGRGVCRRKPRREGQLRVASGVSGWLQRSTMARALELVNTRQ